jgi:RND superfamily putative drug exporter
MTMLLYRLGRVAVRRRRRVLAAWIAAVVLVLALGQTVGGSMDDAFDVPGVEAQHAHDVLEQRFPAAAGTSAELVFTADRGTLTDPGAAATVDDALAAVARQPHVVAVSPLQVARGGRIAFANAQYDETNDEIADDAFTRLEATAESVNRDGPVRMELGGDVPSSALEQPPEGQELIGVLAAMLILLVAFGSFVAMGLPIGTAVIGLATSFGLITLVAAVIDVNTVAPTLAAMIGLGVGIDYALFIVTRHREHLQAGMTVEESAGRAIATSGAAVVFAGLTVVIAICGLAIAGVPTVTVMGFMVALTVLVIMAVSLTLLPALLGFAGHKLDTVHLPFLRSRRSVGPGRETVWHRWGRHVSARPWPYLVGAVALLLVLAAPLVSLRLGMTDNGNKPESLTTRRAYDLLTDGFGPGFNGPLLLSAELDAPAADALGRLERAVAADPGVALVAPLQTSPDGSAAALRVIPDTSPQDELTGDLVHRLRDEVIPAAVDGDDGVEVSVGGRTALAIDMSDRIADRLPWFIAAVIGLSVLLLMVVFRSIAVPIKAAVMNVLSIGAAYGVVVAVFQWGWGKDLFGVHETVPIISFMPMMLFAILFGLSMDYEVFLLSRIREEYLQHGDNERAVVEGIAGTARVITSAALIMISVFAAFVLGDDVEVKMFGLGLAVAVLVDATVVRIVLVPATMKLLGDWNWRFPRRLDRILPNIDLEGTTGLPAPELEPGRGPTDEPGPVREPVPV